MQKLKQFFLSVLALMLVVSSPVGALSENVVISQVQLGDATSASNEFIEIYNNSPDTVDITNWCIYYASATNLQIGSKMSCLTVENANLHLFLDGDKSAFFISNQLSTLNPVMGFDGKFSATLSGSAGHVRLMNGTLEVDKLGWGATALSAEGNKPTQLAPNGKVISRKFLPDGQLQDTDINDDDFELVDAKEVYSTGNIYEVQDMCSNIDGIQVSLPDGYISDDAGNCQSPPVDVCTNLDGMQEVLPAGYQFDENGDCRVDLCLNLDGLQLAIPDGLDKDSLGNCLPHDECINLPDAQAVVPESYILTDDNYCIEKLLPLNITELLPNAMGLDAGNEFIEVFNPNAVEVDLSNYQIIVNSKAYDLPLALIEPAGYYAIYDNTISFSLVNTTSTVSLKSKNGTFVGNSIVYMTAPEGESWADINSDWQYTNQPTPGNANLASVVEVEETEIQLQPCGPNQYRSPDTNRCRNIIIAASTLSDCQAGYERNPETNRCRKIVIEEELAPCEVGYERNPETNRCRQVTVLGASDLTPCQAGYERNPETNRCRKVTTLPITAPYKPEQSLSKSSFDIKSLLPVIVIVLVAIGYGVWEWRSELKVGYKKLSHLLHSRK